MRSCLATSWVRIPPAEDLFVEGHFLDFSRHRLSSCLRAIHIQKMANWQGNISVKNSVCSKSPPQLNYPYVILLIAFMKYLVGTFCQLT